MIVSVNGVPLGTQGNLLCITNEEEKEVINAPFAH